MLRQLFLICILLILSLVWVVDYFLGRLLVVVINVLLIRNVVILATIKLVGQRVELILIAVVRFVLVSILVAVAIVLVAETDHRGLIVGLGSYDFFIIVIVGLAATIDLMLVLLHVVLVDW